jgi:hypothetical protein
VPKTVVRIYTEAGATPFLDWLDRQTVAVQNKLVARTELLEERGHALRRPHADLLRDGIHELRVVSQRVNYRVLYFFHAGAAVITHGFTKEAAVPLREISRAIGYRERYAKSPAEHTYREEEGR